MIDASGGQVDGNTVTYVPKFGERLEINATGSAIDNGEAADVTGGSSDSNLTLILIIVGAVVVVLIVVFLVLRSRRQHGRGCRDPDRVRRVGSGRDPRGVAPPPAPADTAPPPPPMPPAAPPPPPSEG